MLAQVTQKPTMMACEPTSTTAICRVVLARQKQQSTSPNRVPMQLAQCRFPGLTITNDKILAYFSNKIYGSKFIKQHS